MFDYTAAQYSTHCSRRQGMPDAKGLRRPAVGDIDASRCSRPEIAIQIWSRLARAHRGRIYFATKPASFISEALSLSSSSRNFTISLPVRKIGFSACFSM